MSSSALVLAPEVLKRLHQLQQADRPVSVDEILQAANLNHLALPVQQPTVSKSAEIPRKTKHQQDNSCRKTNLTPPLRLEKSASTLTLAERRRIPAPAKKLKLNTKSLSSPSSRGPQPQSTAKQQNTQSIDSTINSNIDTGVGFAVDRSERLEMLEKENAKHASQVSVEYLLSHLERQSGLLHSEPHHQLQVDFDTIRRLVSDNNNGADLPQMTPSSSDKIYQINNTSLLLETASDSHFDWDLWQCMVDDYSTAATKMPHLVSASLRNGGIPHPVRGILWQAMSQSSSSGLEAIYEKLVNDNDGSYAQDMKHDLSQMCATVEMFQKDDGLTQQSMERLLTTYGLYDTQVAYCQDLVFLAGPLLMMMPEKQAFCVFVRLMETHDMRTMFTLDKEGLHIRLYQFQTLLARICPKLDAHLARHSICPAMYASQWYLTLFASSLPLHAVVRIYDLVFAEGAMETVTRAAIVMMQKNEQTLLRMDDFEQIMAHLTSKEFYGTTSQSDAQALIADIVTLSRSVTKIEMDDLAATYDKDLKQESRPTPQSLSIGTASENMDRNTTDADTRNEDVKPTITAKSKRDSWFPWMTSKIVATTASKSDQPTTNSQHTNVTDPTTDQQTEDLAATLSQLQKDKSQLTDQIKTLKMDAEEHTAANSKLLKRNSVLASRLNKYQQEHDQLSSGEQSFASSSFSSPALSSTAYPTDTATSFSELLDKANASRLQILQKDQEFCSFVTSLHSTGEFGALIAAALTTSATKDYLQHGNEDDNGFVDTMDLPRSAIEIEDASEIVTTSDGDDAISKLDAATQELLAMKLANFEMGQKYEDLCHQNEFLVKELAFSQDKEQMYLDQVAVLEKVRADQAQEIDIITSTNERLSERIMAIKQTSAELHMEKLTLMDQVSDLEQDVNELKREKQEYLKPRDSFSEEVFAAHHTLFGEGSVYQQQHLQQQQRQHCLKSENMNNNDYQRKYVDSELRCRELEKLLAETKVKLAEYEAMPSPTQRRPTSFVALKGNGNSNIHGLVLTTRGAGVGSTSMARDDSAATRASIDSMSTTASSKRSSVYSRVWNSLTTPITPSSTDTLPFSNQHNDSKMEDRYQSPTIFQAEFTPI